MTITKFVAAGNTYTFPTSPGDQDMSTNFADLVPRYNKLPGADGAFDEYGFSRAPSEVGTVRFSIFLVSSTTSGMQVLRDSLKRMAAWGKGRLIDSINGTERWCWARVNSISIPEQRHMHTNLFQKVNLTFQVSDPYWYTTGTSTLWGGFTWGGGARWGGTSAGVSVVNGDTITYTNNGSAHTLLKLSLLNSSGNTVSHPIIRRIVNGAVADEIVYGGDIADGEQLVINPHNHTCTIAGVSVLSNLTFKHPDWMRLEPGANVVHFFTNDTLVAAGQYYERYV